MDPQTPQSWQPLGAQMPSPAPPQCDTYFEFHSSEGLKPLSGALGSTRPPSLHAPAHTTTLCLLQCSAWVGVSSLLAPTYHPHPKGALPLGCEMLIVSLKRLGEQGVSPLSTGLGKASPDRRAYHWPTWILFRPPVQGCLLL